MRKSLTIGILKENRGGLERRASLVPQDVKWLTSRGIKVEVESSQSRVFKDSEYKKVGGKIVKKVRSASLLVGIKEPHIEELVPGSIYAIFSHTIKGQPYNMPLLKRILKDNITLLDYEKITDIYGRRIVAFGRFAGICGMLDSFHFLGRKLETKGIVNPFTTIKPSWEYSSMKDAEKDMEKVARFIRRKGLSRKLSPFIIGVTGHGNVSRGVQEVLKALNPSEVHPKDMAKFIRHQKSSRNKIYKIVFLREEKLRAKDGKGFYFEEYLKHPKMFESNLDRYLSHINMLIHTSYWDRRFPRLVTKEMIRKLNRRRGFRLEFIGDISCDVKGSIEITDKATTSESPVFTYEPRKDEYYEGYANEGITVLAIDNLPAEMPKDASQYFSGAIRDYVYQISAHGAIDITNHFALPREVREAVVAESGRLTPNFKYLKKHLSK